MANAGKRRYRIALVEDSDEDVFLISESSRMFPHHIDFIRFATAEVAIAGLTAPDFEPPDGIIIDLNLPGGSGLEVLGTLRRSSALRDSPVVILTSSMSARDRAAAQALGIRAYLEKPTQLISFEQAVTRALQELTAE